MLTYCFLDHSSTHDLASSLPRNLREKLKGIRLFDIYAVSDYEELDSDTTNAPCHRCGEEEREFYDYVIQGELEGAEDQGEFSVTVKVYRGRHPPFELTGHKPTVPKKKANELVEKVASYIVSHWSDVTGDKVRHGPKTR